MQIKLSIDDDEELRRYMKDYLTGIVKSITHGEMSDLISKAVEERISKTSDVFIENVGAKVLLKTPYSEEIRTYIRAIIDDRLRAVIQAECRQIVVDQTCRVREIVREELRNARFQ